MDLMTKGIKRKLDIAYKKVNKIISVQAKGGFYAAGLASEGYNGGYRQAIMDVIQVLNGNKPNFPNTRDFWIKD